MTCLPNHCCHVIQQYLLCVLMSEMSSAWTVGQARPV